MCRADRIALGLARLVAILLALTLPAAAQDEGGTPSKRPTVSRNAPPSPNATINLINLLVKQGVLPLDGRSQSDAKRPRADADQRRRRRAASGS